MHENVGSDEKISNKLLAFQMVAGHEVRMKAKIERYEFKRYCEFL